MATTDNYNDSEQVIRRRVVSMTYNQNRLDGEATTEDNMVPATTTIASRTLSLDNVSTPSPMHHRSSPEGSSDTAEQTPAALMAQKSFSEEREEVQETITFLHETYERGEPVGAETIEMEDRSTQLETDEEEEKDTARLLDQSVDYVPFHESEWAILLQVLFPFLVAGAGMVAAGIVLDIVQHWPVFQQIPEIFILVPALLGLKGNLEMTLASRLSTLANLGRMNSREEQMKVVVSNLALIQVQATVVAFLASLFAIVLAWIPNGNVNWQHAMLLCASSLTTASLASLILGIIMSLVVILSLKYNVNPDNVATPIAASLGDLTTLVVLAVFGSLFLKARAVESVLNVVVVLVFLLSAPLWAYFAAKDTSTAAVLRNGWSPVVFAMLISSGGGFILRFAVSRFGGIAVFQPVINGVGGNLVAVQASRISTSLHQSGKLGSLSNGLAVCMFTNPIRAFCSGDLDSRAARVLIAMVIPGHLFFNFLIHVLGMGHTTITPLFTVVYISAALIQVLILLYVCQWMVRQMWSVGVDPDNSAIPYLTALGDLLGTALLALAFFLLYAVSDKDVDIGE